MTEADKALLLQERLEALVYRFMIVRSGLLRTEAAALSMTELKVLVFIGKNDRCIMREIADSLLIQKNNLTVLVDKLVKKDLALRFRDEMDRRVVRVSLTGTGRRLFNQEMESYRELSRGMLTPLDPEEQDMLIALIDKMIL